MSFLVALLIIAAGPASADAEAEAHAIGQRLRCPVCQGMPISESPSEMAQAMMSKVREMQAEGSSREQIFDYFTQRYGDWVLLEPRKEGVLILLWTLPPIALLLGLFVLRRYTKRGAPAKAGNAAVAASDPYIDAVRREVEQ
ncbi:MAG: cytochrome c-type biogenesis protein CcmH [Myxococcota bacterium]|nr:cytochrome c-type biogenesis protein [Myxococcota bacterium]